MTSIAFFGDSFCCHLKNEHSIVNNYETYIDKLSTHLDAEIIHLGVGGSSIWDCILLQFQETIIKQTPDICIFTWTEAHRLFHRTHRNLNINSIESAHLKKTNPDLHNALIHYFEYLHDFEKHDIEHLSLLHYFDKQILSKHANTKFIHLWSFKDAMNYRWENGVEIRPSLIELSMASMDDLPKSDTRANHLDGEEKNTLLYNIIIEAINNYQNGKLVNFNYQGFKND